jgi:hypothetical protein
MSTAKRRSRNPAPTPAVPSAWTRKTAAGIAAARPTMLPGTAAGKNAQIVSHLPNGPLAVVTHQADGVTLELFGVRFSVLYHVPDSRSLLAPSGVRETGSTPWCPFAPSGWWAVRVRCDRTSLVVAAHPRRTSEGKPTPMQQLQRRTRITSPESWMSLARLRGSGRSL